MSGDTAKPLTLPSGPATLCFDKDDFMKNTFNVDTFVMDCRRCVPLETLRDDLHIYLKILRSAMIELINKDYADFVNLSTNLVGMDKAINNLTEPLGQFKEEVLCVTSAMDNAIEAVEEKLNQRQKIKDKKACLQGLINIVLSVEKIEKLLGLTHNMEPSSGARLNGQLIERVATEFNKLQFYVTKSRGLPLVEEVKPRIASITSTLQYSLEGSFLEGLDNNNVDILRQCLRTYALIDKIKDAEALFRKHVARPFMEEVITEDFLRTSHQGLKGMYIKILEFVPKHCHILKDITSSSTSGDVVRGYDFIVNSVLPEIVCNIEARTPSIFAPGNPNLFHEKYTISMDFMSKFEQQCGSQASVKRLREHSSYQVFMSRWSLPVYFQIRFQEIAGAFENSLLSGLNNAPDGSDIYLHASFHLWESICHCWQPDVYLPTLMHRFLKLNLQLLSRYSSWIDEIYQKENQKSSNTNILKNERASTPASNNNSSSNNKQNGLEQNNQTSTSCESEPITLGQILCLLADAEKTSERIFPMFEKDIRPKLESIGYQNIDLIKDAFNDSQTNVLCNVPKFQNSVIQELTCQCSVHLKQVADIPRLFRRTNREVPTKTSSYTTGLFKPLNMFFSEHKAILSESRKQAIAKQVLENLAQQYYTSTSDVLTSVKKMEDSLKRLKKARGTGVSTGLPGMTDDDKIRQQLIIDIEHYAQQVESFGFDSKTLHGCTQLSALCEEARIAMTNPNPSSSSSSALTPKPAS
ncbi:conserved oligomeric Golgi complex subunit 2 [Octopus sinensis]|uniref:Conserved oligomeric Golgi complex subunit 2 n=1 Tax=Octopus sinensis TaxID=2607531 RepID=A0A6P7SWN8_9MOLL|nr:conserved oligomeric Golgi complex subunit 2 [Octopus sinensis]